MKNYSKRILINDCVNLIGDKVDLYGWVAKIRDHGKITFINLRDRSGVIQCVIGGGNKEIKAESVIHVTGTVKNRTQENINKNLPTGSIEIDVDKLDLITLSRQLPFPIDSQGYEVNEEIRTKYRYLDLRRQRMNRNIRLRSKVTTFIRNYLTKKEFVEIETPILTKTTPEGARDFIVPSRLQKGKFYALPQSPQQYKQLLMVAGFERYFQIVRCFRDEDPRADRAYGEFTQLDMELSFVNQEDILNLIEDLMISIVREIFPWKKISSTPFPRITHKDAVEKWGNDKPDIRKNKNDPDELAFAWVIDFPLFKEQSEDDFFYGSGKAKFAPSHHMFTSPHPDDVVLLESNPLKVRGLQHDLVLNGFEVGGGSIRIHNPKVQEKIFDLIGFTEKQKKEFEHMLNAFSYGVPPHGGIAPGIDRLIMTILGEQSVREVMAFPTLSSGLTSVMDAPSFAADNQLKELGMQCLLREKGKIIREEIENILDLGQVKYMIHKHGNADVLKNDKSSLVYTVKTMMLKSDNNFILAVLPIGRKIDFAKLKNILNCTKVKLASEEDVEKITGIKVSVVPPFGNIFGLRIIADEGIKSGDKIYFNAGQQNLLIEMNAKDYLNTVKPEICNFSL